MTDICGNPRVGVADIFRSLYSLSPSSLEVWLRMAIIHEGQRNMQLLLVAEKDPKDFQVFLS